jgi:hypothetical protein
MVSMPRVQHPDGTFGCSINWYVRRKALDRLGIAPGPGPAKRIGWWKSGP